MNSKNNHQTFQSENINEANTSVLMNENSLRDLKKLYKQFERVCIEKLYSQIRLIDEKTAKPNLRNFSNIGRPIFEEHERLASMKFSKCLSKFNRLNLKYLHKAFRDETLPKIDINMVFTILSHNRPEILNRSLIDGQLNVESIHKSFLVVSQDGFFEPIYEILKKASFKLPLRFFFKDQSCQDLRDIFPAETSNDCLEKTKIEDQSSFNCSGKADVYGHFRSQLYTSLKHHQIQMVNQLYNKWIPTLISNQQTDIQTFVFEEDHFVSPKLLKHLEKIIEIKDFLCPQCNGINIKSNVQRNQDYEKIRFLIKGSKEFQATPLRNMGYGQSYATQKSHMRDSICNSNFCHYNDYNQDQSYQSQINSGYFLSHSNLVVEHLSSCSGLHSVNCILNNENEQISYKKLMLENMNSNYKDLDIEQIKSNVELEEQNEKVKKSDVAVIKSKIEEYGGQSDERDIRLCESQCLI